MVNRRTYSFVKNILLKKRQNSYKWKILAENIPVGIIILSTNILYANNWSKDLFGENDILQSLEELEYQDKSENSKFIDDF